jgi:DNA-binding GntR family transcriptional regulator
MPPDRLVPKQLWEEVAAILRRVVETDLAERFGVSRGPIREALRELERAGLAVDRPRRGVFVSTPTETDMEEITVFRETLETAAARIAIPNVLAGDVARLRALLGVMEAAYADLDRGAGLAADVAFHREIFVLAANSRMLAAHDDISAQMLHSWVHDHRLRDDVFPPPSLHGDIVDALEAGDEERVALAVAAHYAWLDDRMIGWEGDTIPVGEQP